ncbi:ImmA/IrrE family metallo-endopeptidase [Microbispora sp. ZYX-F-249]|uniref:ImmA/IrrE family metallo-endopeptidase n=1 Tax=Microbispora maris TaxID=3144104 RepID=A0ABV0AVS5_9ACTN
MTSRASEAVQMQVTAMLDLLERDRPGMLDRLRTDALAELQTWPEVRVHLVTEALPTAEGCSVAGSYGDEEQPPALCVVRSASTRRRQFTVLHELGHHLQRTDLDLGTAVVLADGDRFEDDACDLFAARVLLPDSLVASCFDDRTPIPGDIVALYRKSSASRAACMVRAAEHLSSFGAVVLYDAAGVVSFAAARGSVYPPARGSDQSQTALVAAALRDPSRADGMPFTVDDTRIRYRSGHASGPLYGQATWCDGYLVAVLVEHHAPWRTFSPPRDIIPSRQPQWAECQVCVNSYEVTDICGTCGEPRCPSGHCECSLRRERHCERCKLTYGPAMFPGNGAICRDCL